MALNVLLRADPSLRYSPLKEEAINSLRWTDGSTCPTERSSVRVSSRASRLEVEVLSYQPRCVPFSLFFSSCVSPLLSLEHDEEFVPSSPILHPSMSPVCQADPILGWLLLAAE